MADLIGKKILHYRIIEQVGQGGMGMVYKAEDTRLLRKVAIKILTGRQTTHARSRKRFIHEARTASALNHPNICTVYDIGESDGQDFIVMEYLEGMTLRQTIKERGPLPEKEAAQIFIQICGALSAAHGKGIVHRDIKPENIMISADGQVKVMDFGLAKLVGENSTPSVRSSSLEFDGDHLQTSASGLEGTALYMAPEQIEKGRIDERTDMYAVGTVLFEVLTGKPPFQGSNSLALLEAILEQPPPAADLLRPGLSRLICGAIQKALSKSPAERYRTIAQLQAILESVVSPRRRPAAFRVIWPILFALVTAGMVLWVAGWKSDGLNVSTRNLRLTAESTGTPILSPDGTQIAYLVDRDGGLYRQSLVFKDLLSGRTNRLDLHGSMDTDLLLSCSDWSPNGMLILVTCHGGGIKSINTRDGSVKQYCNFGYEPLWSPDGKKMAFSRFEPNKLTTNNEVWIYDRAPGITRRVSPEDGLSYHSPSWSPDGKWVVCVAGIGSNRALWLLHIETQETHKFIEISEGVERPVWSGKGDHIYFATSGDELWRVAVDTDPYEVMKEPERVVENLQAIGFNLSRNGSNLVFTQSALTEEFWQFELPFASENPWVNAELLLKPQSWGTTNLDVAPDGNALILETVESSPRSLKLLSLANADPMILYNEQDAFGPSWSRDGKWIAFDAGGGDDADIWRVALADGAAEKVFEHPGADWMPRYSPDGKKLSFLSNRDGQFDIWLYGIDSLGFQKVTNTPAMESGGYWSNDSRKLAFFSNAHSANKSSLWVLDLETGSDKKVHDIPQRVDATATIVWGPGDGRLFFHDGQAFAELDLATGEVGYPLDVADRRTKYIRYTIHEKHLYLILKKFGSRIFLVEGLE